jgi:hypothetical protein
MNNLMIDLETLDNVPGGVILSIGAVFFDPRSDELGATFHAVIDTYSCEGAGLTVSDDTLIWWNAQSPEARAVLEYAASGRARPLRAVLTDFNCWVKDSAADVVHVWGNGADFDNAFLAVAYRMAGAIPLPWKFWHNRCFRTLKSLPFLRETPLPKLEGTAHNALDDAIYQAHCAVILLRKLDAMGVALEVAKVRPVGDTKPVLTQDESPTSSVTAATTPSGS